MKRFIFLVIVLTLVTAFIAFPALAKPQISTSQPTAQSLSQDFRSVEKAEMSLGDCPVWAQLLVAGVVGLFGLLAIVPMFIRPEAETTR